MIAPQFIHNLTTSFTLWADYTLLKKGFAYTNTTGQLYNYTDSRLPSSYQVFGAPYKQWVTDSSITVAVIPSGFYSNSIFKPRSTGTLIDFNDGRIISNEIQSSAIVTGAYSVKDFNIYYTNQDEESLVIEKCEENSKIGTDIATTYLPAYTQKIPAIFINNQTQNNIPLAFGGMDETRVKLNIVVFAKDP